MVLSVECGRKAGIKIRLFCCTEAFPRLQPEVLKKLRRRYESVGAERKRKLLNQAQHKVGFNPFGLKQAVDRGLKEIVTVTFGARRNSESGAF